MKKETLLEKAKRVPLLRSKRHNWTEEHEEVGVAWMKDEISLSQIARTVFPDMKESSSTSRVMSALAIWVREAYRKGKIKVA